MISLLVFSLHLFSWRRVNTLYSDVERLCPASSNLNIKRGYHSYPLDIFNKSWNANAAITNAYKPSQLDRVTCITFFHHIQYIHDCPAVPQLRICPLTEDNIVTASTYKWPVNVTMASLCHLHQQLHNPQAKVRVFIIGGSFTEGRSTTGCCCNPLIDARCPSNNECYNTNEPIDGSRTCRWSNFLAMLLLDKYKAEIIVLNLASRYITLLSPILVPLPTVN